MNLLDLKREIATIEGELSSNDYLKSRPDLLASANDKLEKLKLKLLEKEGGGSKDHIANKILAHKTMVHVKMYKLSRLGYDNKQIATFIGTSAGHVWNVLNEYDKKPEKVAYANKIIIPNL